MDGKSAIRFRAELSSSWEQTYGKDWRLSIWAAYGEPGISNHASKRDYQMTVNSKDKQ